MTEDLILPPYEEENFDYSAFLRFFLLEFTKELIKNYAPSEILKVRNVFEEEKLKLEETQKEIPKIKGKEGIEPEGVELPFVPRPEKRKIVIVPEEIEIPAVPTPTSEKEKFEPMEFEFPTSSLEKFPVSEEEKMFRVTKEEGVPEEEEFRKIFVTPIKRRVREIGAPIIKTPAITVEKKEIEEMPPSRMRLIIPETRLPYHLEYIKPIPIAKEIDLGKLNPYIKDQFVREIECYGEGENLVVKGNMGIKKIGIVFSKEEIMEIVRIFSEESKIPVHEGIFKVAVGGLLFLAVISEVIGTKFTIKKIEYEPEQNYPHYYR